jgi:hypothetical protein
MTEQMTFLDRLADVLINKSGTTLTDTVVVLPNKRARVFLIEALGKQVTNNILAPQIISIEEFVQDVAGVRAIDPVELLFEFYEVYLKLTPESQQQPFDQFANWAKTLLQDFNEIDRYLLDPMYVLSYLKDIEDIKKWGIDVDQKTKLLESYIDFWKLLPGYYEALYTHLMNKGTGYQGLIYREAVNNLNHFTDTVTGQRFVFAGFNALNAAEERIVQHLLAQDKARIYWDIDKTFLDDPMHDAGLFIRRFRANWKHYRNHPFEWIMNEFAEEKHIQVIGTPKTIGQAKIAGSIIAEGYDQGNTPEKTAIVLGDESLLLPVLYALPSSVPALNITMGYSSSNNPAQILIAKLFKMHSNALSRSSYVFYHKDVLDILTHPLVEPYAGARTLVNTINRNNYTFIPASTLQNLQAHPNEFFNLLFDRWEEKPSEVLGRLAATLLHLKNSLGSDNANDKISKAFVYSIFKVINKLRSYSDNYGHISNISTLHAIYKQSVDLAEVSFEGEPLNGLQIMGVLESRVLDFDTVIVTSMNEGKFPAGKGGNSFIPYDVKRELGLPTFKEKDAIYTYHFYHLLQRAKNIYLLYNTATEGLDAGERSRFITQLEVEKKPAHHITFETFTASLPSSVSPPVVIPKSESVMLRLQQIAHTGFSPSALTMYVRNPLDFYYRKILRISEVDEVEENIAMNTLGTIIHEALLALYTPFIGRILTEAEVTGCFNLVDQEVLQQFKKVYKEGEIRKGRNLLAFEVAKRNVHNFLKTELQALQQGEVVQIIALEKTYQRVLEHARLPYPVLIKGNVDRIEMRDGKIRIIDYKTGRVDAGHVSLKQWDGLMDDIKSDKIIQLLAYAYMYAPEVNGREIEAGIISFKNLKSGFLPFCYKEDKTRIKVINDDIAGNYLEQLVGLLEEILDQEKPFTERIK